MIAWEEGASMMTWQERETEFQKQEQERRRQLARQDKIMAGIALVGFVAYLIMCCFWPETGR